MCVMPSKIALARAMRVTTRGLTGAARRRARDRHARTHRSTIMAPSGEQQY
jgi:hypothetical protein